MNAKADPAPIISRPRKSKGRVYPAAKMKQPRAQSAAFQYKSEPVL